jgi:hypothetical protein
MESGHWVFRFMETRIETIQSRPGRQPVVQEY